MKKLSVLRMVSLGAVFAMAFGVAYFVSGEAQARLVEGGGGCGRNLCLTEGGTGGGSSTNTSSNTGSSSPGTYHANGVCY